jgi:putative transposase
MKNIIHLDNHYLPQDLGARISEWVDYYNSNRCHESLENITPADKYDGWKNQIFSERRKIKQKTLGLR